VGKEIGKKEKKVVVDGDLVYNGSKAGNDAHGGVKNIFNT
jgi:hypothetical protein